MYIITGSSSGIGSELCKIFKENNIDYLGIDIKPNADYVCDVSSQKEILDLVEFLKNKNIFVDGLVLCAGVFSNSKNIVSINYFGAKNFIETFYKEFNYVDAVLVGSIVSKIYQIDRSLVDTLLANDAYHDDIVDKQLTDTAVYASSKLALELWMQNFIKNKKCRVNIVHPGLVKTDKIKNILNKSIIETIFNKDVLEKSLEVQDIAEDIFIISTKLKKMIGQSIAIDNGVTCV